ncbi:MAG: hypothetical protein K0R57_578 [Paenibacillaceae bacterium]|nr:hypothetical protein [Paenibacillaceae bacterium]
MNKKTMSRMLLTVMAVMAVLLVSALHMGSAHAEADETKLTVMSLNVLTSLNQPIEAVHNGKTRGDMLTELIDGRQPDSIGLNEVNQGWRDYVLDHVLTYPFQGGAAYGITGLVADDGITSLMSGYSEFSPILYRSDLYDIEAAGGYWFSATPDVKSKYGDITDSQGRLLYKGMSNSRIMSYAVFKYKDTNEIAYIHINSHYDHQSSDYIQTLCSIQVKKKADELAFQYQSPVVLTGDINAKEESQAYHYLADGKNGYLNAKYVSDQYSVLPSSAGFGANYNEAETSVIDHIFISAGNVGVYKHDMLSNPYLSDHSAVYAELSLRHMPKLDSMSADNQAVPEFSGKQFLYRLYTMESQLSLNMSYNADYTVTAASLPAPAAAVTQGQSVLQFQLDEGDNPVLLYVKDSAGRTTTYTLHFYRETGEAKPVISEIYPNAIPGYKYFEVTNAGTRSMSTDEYAFLWGNIGGDASVNWESVLEVSESRVIRPGASVVFWFTYNTGGVFSHVPSVADFNDHYRTLLSEENIVVFGQSEPFKGYSTASGTAVFTMGANKDRGMRIAYARDTNGTPYGWTQRSTNSSFNGPTASVSSYKSLSPENLTPNQLFKFKLVEGQTAASPSDVLDAFYASPGIYDTRIGNEPKDAYTRIEAGEYDTFSLVHAEGNNLGGSLAGSWAFYSNVQFGDTGADAAVFSAAVKESNASGTVEIYIDGKSDGTLVNATKIGTLVTTPTGPDWSVFSTFTCSLSQRVIGTHHVTLVFKPNAGKTYAGNLDYFVFTPYVPKPDLAEITGMTFLLDGNPLTAGAQLNADREHTSFTVSAEAAYLPANADFTIKWSSSRPDIAIIDEATGVIQVLGYGDFIIDAAVYSNRQWFHSYPSPVIATNYKQSAFTLLEGEWAAGFTPGANKTPNAKKAAAAATGMSPNVTGGYNYIGDVVDQSSMTLASVDFGSRGIKGFIMNMALKRTTSGGTVTLYADTVDECHKIGQLTVSVTADTPDNYNTYLPYTGTITKSVTGIHNLILVFSTSNTYVGNIDYLVFEE